MSIQLVGEYVPSQLTVVISTPFNNGVHVVTDFAKDTMIDIERGDPAWTWNPSNKGNSGAYVHNADKTATVTLHLQQTSLSNDILSKIVDFDSRNFRGRGNVVVSIVDASGRTALFSSVAKVSQLPNQSFGSELSVNDWQIIMPTSDWHVGGNSQVTSEVEQLLSDLGYTIDEDWVIN